MLPEEIWCQLERHIEHIEANHFGTEEDCKGKCTIFKKGE
jgi:hypothetical protein